MSSIGAGGALLLAEPPLNKPHLWFILTDPEGQPARVVAVMLRTVTKFTDHTVVLTRGDHPFVRHSSSVHYSTARWFDLAAIEAELRSGRCHHKEDMSEELLRRVREGLMASPFTVHAVRDYCRTQFSK